MPAILLCMTASTPAGAVRFLSAAWSSNSVEDSRARVAKRRLMAKAVAAVIAVVIVIVSVVVLSRRPVGFDVTVTTDAARYGEGDVATMTTRVCSNRWWLSRMSAGHITWEVVDRTGSPVANNSHAIRTTDIRTEWWRPGQCRTFAVEWDLRTWNQAAREAGAGGALGEPVRGVPVPPGDYRFVATWHAARHGEPPRPMERAASPWLAVAG